MISVPALPHYSWGGVLPLSFIVRHKANLWHSSLSAQATGVSNPLHSLSLRPSTSVIVLMFLSLRRQSKIHVHRGLPSPLSVLLVLANFIFPPIILTYSSHISNSSVTGTYLSLCTPSRYPIYLLKMNNTRLPCLTATAGTRFGRDLWI